jgi:addiction module HigA family antidote
MRNVERIKVMTRPAIHAGEILAGELEEIGVLPTELARQIDVPPSRISQIINGKRSITGDTALRLAHWFGTSPKFWLDLQIAYDLRIAEQEAGSQISQLPTRTVADATQHLPAQ